MSTYIALAEVRDQALTQLLAVAAVTAAFPVTALVYSASVTNRFLTQHKLLLITPANVQILDEQGDLLAVYFVAPSPYPYVFTQKGKRRAELEQGAAPAGSV